MSGPRRDARVPAPLLAEARFRAGTNCLGRAGWHRRGHSLDTGHEEVNFQETVENRDSEGPD